MKRLYTGESLRRNTGDGKEDTGIFDCDDHGCFRSTDQAANIKRRRSADGKQAGGHRKLSMRSREKRHKGRNTGGGGNRNCQRTGCEHRRFFPDSWDVFPCGMQPSSGD